MLLLIAAHRHQVRLIEQNIRRHQSRIGEQARVDVVCIFGGLILELGHPGELTEHGVAVQHPAQLSMGGNVRLHKQHVLLRVQSAGDVGRQLGQGMAAQLRRHLPHGNGVHVRQHIIAVVFICQSGPVLDGTQIRPQRQVAGGLNTAENPLFLHFVFHKLEHLKSFY